MGKVADTIEEVFKKELPGNTFVVESSTEIGPSVGDKLRKDTLIAMVISMLGIIIYIAWRFDFKFGVGATVATLHDVLAMFAVFFVFNKEINLLFITAVLTIAGYSLTDTVVVFDRIRENLHKDLKEAMHNIFNQSINEVLSRTIVTSLTTFLASLSLLFLGGEVIHDFALALVVGVAVGTYSSIFVASPIVAYGRAGPGRPKHKEVSALKKENMLFFVIAIIVGLLGGYLIFSVSSKKEAAPVGGGVPVGAGSPADYRLRIETAEKIVAADPKNLQAWVQLGNDYFDTAQPQKAINAYAKALELKPDDPNVLTDQGVMYRQLRQFDKALANFEKAQQTESESSAKSVQSRDGLRRGPETAR